MSVISDFVTGLPSYNADNFTKYSGATRSSKRPSTYVQTKDSPSEIIIVNEKTNVLLRYLYRKWEKEEERNKKRCHSDPSLPPKKKRKTEQDEDSS